MNGEPRLAKRDQSYVLINRHLLSEKLIELTNQSEENKARQCSEMPCVLSEKHREGALT